jgi:catechol 2,3-dioxygenase-like lactoylglutathione lyase family enzyme
MPVTQLLKISTTVADLAKAAAFYAERLGFVPGAETAIDDPAFLQLLGLEAGVTARSVTLRLGRQEVELIAFDPPGSAYPPNSASNDQWFQHIALVAGDMTFAWNRLRCGPFAAISEGGPQLLPPNTGSVAAFKFRDLEGHPLELIRFPQGVGAPIWHGMTGSDVVGYDHTAISVMDVDRSLAFYTELLGFKVGGRSLNRGVEQDRLDGLSGCEVDVIALQPTEVATPHVELLHYRTPAGRPLSSEVRACDVASTRPIHRASDLDRLVGRLREAKVAFVSPGVVRLKDGGQAVAIRDPDGHMIVLMA